MMLVKVLEISTVSFVYVYLLICMCSGFRARDREKSKQHLLVNSTNPRTSPHTSTKRREGINPIESALKPQLYILITA